MATQTDHTRWQQELARRPRDAARLAALLRVFTPRQRARLRFARWLVATGRLAG